MRIAVCNMTDDQAIANAAFPAPPNTHPHSHRHRDPATSHLHHPAHPSHLSILRLRTAWQACPASASHHQDKAHLHFTAQNGRNNKRLDSHFLALPKQQVSHRHLVIEKEHARSRSTSRKKRIGGIASKSGRGWNKRRRIKLSLVRRCCTSQSLLVQLAHMVRTEF